MVIYCNLVYSKFLINSAKAIHPIASFDKLAYHLLMKLYQGWKLGPCKSCCNDIYVSNTAAGSKPYNKQQPTPMQHKLSNYPNLFAGSSTIQYALPVDSKVTIKVYDVLGRSVTTLVDEYKKAG